MDESGINIATPKTDPKTLRAVLELLDNNNLVVPGMPRLLSAQILAQNINSGKIRAMEKNGTAEKTIIGLAIACLLDEANDCGLFSLVFDPALAVNDLGTIAAAIKEFKLYYQGKGLSKISVLLVLPTTKAMPSLMTNCGFIEEAFLGSQFKELDTYKSCILFSATNNGREIKPLTERVILPEKNGAKNKLQEQIQDLAAQLNEAIKKLHETEKVKMLSEKNLAVREKEIALKIEEIKELKNSLVGVPKVEKDQKIRDLESEIEALKKEAADAKKEKEKYKEWLDKKNEEFKIAEEKIRLLETELEKSKNEALEKKIPEETTLRETGKLSDAAIRILKVVNEQGPEGITQKEIVAKTGIQQGTVSYNVTKVLLLAGLIIKVSTGKKRAKIAPNAEKNKEISNLSLEREEPVELADTIQKDPKSEEVKQEEKKETQQPLSEHEGNPSANPANDDKKLIVVEGLSLTAEEKVLNSVLDPNSPQIKKGLDEMIEALEGGKRIKADVLGSNCKIKKTDMQTFVLLLSKKINTEARKHGSTESPIKSVTIHHPNDYEQAEIELGIKPIESDVDGTPVPQSKSANKIETPRHVQKSIAEICAACKFSEVQGEILVILRENGGKLEEEELKGLLENPRDETRKRKQIKHQTFDAYLKDLQEHKVIEVEGTSTIILKI